MEVFNESDDAESSPPPPPTPPANESSASSLLTIPDGVEALRQRIFNLAEDVVLTTTEFAVYWPYFDNIYILNQNRQSKKNPAVERKSWRCRLYEKAFKTHVPLENRQRNCTARIRISCPCRIKSVHDGVSVVLSRTSPEGHNHELQALNFKNSSAVLKVLQREVEKGYRPCDISNNVLNSRNGNLQALQRAGGTNVNRKTVDNAGHVWRRSHPDTRLVIGDVPAPIQVDAAVEFLNKQADWRIQSVQVGTSTGIVFASEYGLQNLTRRGHLTLMDSTHKTNKLAWLLTTLMIRDEYKSWVPAAFILHDAGDSDILAEALIQVKRWCCHRWLLRYMLTDDSAAEQAAVKKAFQGLQHGEQEVTHILCITHSIRTLKRHFGHPTKKDIFAHLYTALMTRRTKTGCIDSIQSAIKACKDDTAAVDYIKKEWLQHPEPWAMCARQHSSLLLQVRTTSPLESWHKSLKNNSKVLMGKWSLRGIIEHVVEISTKWRLKASRMEQAFRTKMVTEFHDMPILQRFPYPVQELILKEYRYIEKEAEEGEDDVELHELHDDVSCRCLFYRRWQLPCRHILKQEALFGGILTDEYWGNWIRKWEESGFELYEGMTVDYMNNAVDSEIGAPVRRKLEVREVLDGLLTAYYSFEENTTTWPADLRDEAIRNWTKALDKLTGPLRQEGVEQLKRHLSLESQKALEASQSAYKHAECVDVDLQYIDPEELEG